MTSGAAVADIHPIKGGFGVLRILPLVFVLAFGGTRPAVGGSPPPEKCTAKKETSVGNYSQCRLKAHAKATLGNILDFTKCDARFDKDWVKAESQGNCPTVGDGADHKAATQTFTTNAAVALAVTRPGSGLRVLDSTGKQIGIPLGVNDNDMTIALFVNNTMASIGAGPGGLNARPWTVVYESSDCTGPAYMFANLLIPEARQLGDTLYYAVAPIESRTIRSVESAIGPNQVKTCFSQSASIDYVGAIASILLVDLNLVPPFRVDAP